ncbi:AraC family transcriptional regulator [Ralstonia sp. 24A2]|uniref:AraC family transcriptional regulator n=1 Tax=Ralstonia sp. 24A2 TaxID=3447364 RepID=UPI003F699515
MPSQPLLPTQRVQSAGGRWLYAVDQTSQSPRTTAPHSHARGQLFGTDAGVLTVQTAEGRSVIPAGQAIWIPPGVEHGAETHGPFVGWAAYLAADACVDLPDVPCTLSMSALLRAAISRAATWADDVLDPAQQRIAAVIADEIRTLTPAPTALPMPVDARLRKIAHALIADPSDTRRLQDWADWAAVAPRTLTRRFACETGYAFETWRHRLRMMCALEQLAAGAPVTTVALDLGYDNVSAFIARFRATFGITPGRYAAGGSTTLTLTSSPTDKPIPPAY